MLILNTDIIDEILAENYKIQSLFPNKKNTLEFCLKREYSKKFRNLSSLCQQIFFSLSALIKNHYLIVISNECLFHLLQKEFSLSEIEQAIDTLQNSDFIRMFQCKQGIAFYFNPKILFFWGKENEFSAVQILSDQEKYQFCILDNTNTIIYKADELL